MKCTLCIQLVLATPDRGGCDENRRRFWRQRRLRVRLLAVLSIRACAAARTLDCSARPSRVSPQRGARRRGRRSARGLQPVVPSRSPHAYLHAFPALCPYLSLSEREEIAILRAGGHGVREIARRLGRSPSTISMELDRNAPSRGGYLVTVAQLHSERRARRPRTPATLFGARYEASSLPAPPAVSATATACPGRGRDGRVPFPGASSASAHSGWAPHHFPQVVAPGGLDVAEAGVEGVFEGHRGAAGEEAVDEALAGLGAALVLE